MREQLGELDGPVAARLLDPRGRLDVGAAAFLSREALVRNVADEDVLEAVFRLAGERRRDPLENELPAKERSDDGIEVVDTGDPRDCAAPEHAPDDRGALGDALLLG